MGDPLKTAFARKRPEEDSKFRPCLEGLEHRDVPATWGFAWPMPQIMTISFVPDGTKVGQLSSDLSSYADRTWGAGWQREALRALQAWIPNAAINIGLRADDGQPLGAPGLREGSNHFGDIRVAAVPMSNDVIASAVPFEPAAGTWSGDVLINSTNSGPGHDAYSIFLHEFGHVFGFADNLDPTSVNFRYFAGQRSNLSPADAAALQALYGPRQPDSHEGTTGNDIPATATTVTFAAGETSKAFAADITTATDVDDYVVTLPAGATRLEVELKTSGLSLLVGSLGVVDAAGSVVASASATDPRSGDLTVVVPQAAPGQVYRISVRAADPAFAVGQYALAINTGSNSGEAPQSAFLKEYGSTYLLSILNDGVASNTSDFQDILRILLSGGPDTSAYNASVDEALNAYLAHIASTSPSASFGTVFAQLLSQQGSSQIIPGQLGQLIDRLGQSGVLKQVLEDLIQSGAFDKIVGALSASGQIDGLLQNLMTSGAFSQLLESAIASPQGPNLLSEVCTLIRQTFGSTMGQPTSSDGHLLTAQNMLDFYRVLLDGGELDPVFNSFLASGLLSQAFESLPPETLTRGFQITLSLLARPDRLGQELRQFFEASGMANSTGPVTPEASLGLLGALSHTDFFDDYFRAMMDAGGLDEVSAVLASSGNLDKVFGNYLATGNIVDLINLFARNDSLRTILPLLSQTDVLEQIIRSAEATGTCDLIWLGLDRSGVLPQLIDDMAASGTLVPLIHSLMSTDAFANVLVQQIQSGELQPIMQGLLSSGTLAGMIDSLIESGQFAPILDDILSDNSPEMVSALASLAQLFMPTPATTFDAAVPLAAATSSGATGVRSLSAVGQLGDANPFGFYKLVVPATPKGAPASMIVGAWSDKDTSIRPEILVFDQDRRPVPVQVVDADDDYVVQVLNPVPGQTYYIMVREESPVGNQQQGVFGIQAIFCDTPVQMGEIVGQSLDAATPRVESPFVVTDARVYHWFLSAEGGDGDGVALTVLDSAGRVVQTLQAATGKAAGVDLLLNQGTYTLVFSRSGGASTVGSALRFSLTGFELSDLMKPAPIDPSLQPVAGGATAPSPRATAAEAIAQASRVGGLARVDPASSPYMATFGSQAGAGAATVVIAKGPGGPHRSFPTGPVAPGPGNPSTGPEGTAEVVAGQPPAGPARAGGSVLAFSAPTATPGRALAVPPPSDGPVPTAGLGLEGEILPEAVTKGAWEALARVASSFNIREIVSGQEHPHFLMGAVFAGGLGAAHKLRNKKPRPKPGRSSQARHPEDGRANPDGPSGPGRPPGLGRPVSPSSPRRAVLIGPPGPSSAGDREAIRAWLEEDGTEVRPFDRADWDEIVAWRPDLLLIEHVPPGLDALGILDAWQAHPQARSVPAVLVAEGSTVVARGLDTGASDVVAPSAGPVEFRSRLRAVMRLRARFNALELHASQDGLTGLPNRSAFEDRLAHDWADCERSNSPISLMILDIDRFKGINDCHGHAVGDEVLRKVATTISSALGDGDLAARYGGEEFAIIAPGCDRAGAESLAERIRRRVAGITFSLTPELCGVTVSIGIASIAEPASDDAEDGLRRADQALYLAKSEGRNTVRAWDDLP